MCELQPILDSALMGSCTEYEDTFVDEGPLGGCGDAVLLAEDTSGKVFNVTMVMTCRNRS